MLGYDGPLTLAIDSMAWNITKDKIVDRMTVPPDHAWSVPGAIPPPAPLKESVPDPLSDEMNTGAWNLVDVQGKMIKAFKTERNMDKPRLPGESKGMERIPETRCREQRGGVHEVLVLRLRHQCRIFQASFAGAASPAIRG